MKTIVKISAALLLFIGCKTETNSEENKIDLTMEQATEIPKMETEREAIKTSILKLFRETDNRNWDAVKETMADSVYVNYTALGGDEGFKTPNEIIDGWRQLLPGFERTIHQAHNFAIWPVGNRATATLDAIATHYLEGRDWTVFVGYDTEYIQENNQWKLARIDLSLYNQTGDTNLPNVAIQNVKDGNIPNFLHIESSKTKVIESFFTALENRNLKNLMASLSANMVQEMPLSPENFPKTLDGIDAMRKQYSGVMDYSQRYEREYMATSDPNVILAKYNGIITTGEGKPYNNSYVGIFTLNDAGKLSNFVEYFNPKILLTSWPGLQPSHYSVHEAGAATDSGVKLEKVTFNSSGINLVGHLFFPPNFDHTKKYPTAIVTGSWTSIKEQMPDEYASVMAKDGFITFTFDFTGFGESEGQPRQVEDYNLKIADIKAAVDFLTEHPNVDTDELSGLGVCASSGYMAHATAEDKRIKKLILVAPWLHNADVARLLYDNRPGGYDGLIASAREAKEKYAETGEMEYVLAASELDPLSAMYVPHGAFDYYLNPAKGAGKKYDNRFAVSSWEPWLTFDGIGASKDIDQPVFIVHSERGAVPQGAKDFYVQLKGQKDIVWLNQYNQQQLYSEDDAVNAAMSEVVNYLKQKKQ